MRPENCKDYIPPQHAIGGRKARCARAVILVELRITDGVYADHHPDIPPPVWPGASSRRSGFATAAGLCCASSGSDSTGSIRFPLAANVLVVDAEDAISRQITSETNRPFEKLKRRLSIHMAAVCAGRRRARLASLCWLEAVGTRFGPQGSRSASPSRKHAHPRIYRRAFRRHHCGRTRPPTEREPEALHRHGDEERELK